MSIIMTLIQKIVPVKLVMIYHLTWQTAQVKVFVNKITTYNVFIQILMSAQRLILVLRFVSTQ